MSSSSVRTKNIKNNSANGGYIIIFTLTERINTGCSIFEMPILKKELIGHKVVITDGVTPTNGIVIRQGYIFFMNDINIYYTPGSRLYVLTEKYKSYELPRIYDDYTQKLTDVTYYIREIKGASLAISMSFNVDYNTLAGTPELNDVLESNFIRTISDAMDIEPSRIVVTAINPGSVVIKFIILESSDATAPSPVDLGENLKFQLSRQDSQLYKDSFMRTAKSINISVTIKDLSITDADYLFMRDYYVHIYEKIVNDEIDVLGDIFEFLNISIE
jgi:hypothetical protein